MKLTNSLTARILCRTLAVVLLNATVPLGIPKLVADALPKGKPAPVKKAMPASHLLSAKQMKTLQGKYGSNPYMAGQAKWDPVLKGVDLLTGNYSTSVTDMDFEGGYGIPVNVTRSYSSNNADSEGPFGWGWTLSADVRSTAGGLLKGPSAPVRAVPATLTEQPPMEYNPNAQAANGSGGGGGSTTASHGTLVPNPAVQAAVSTDAGGTAETIQKDVDGILTTPPWDNNVHNSVYQLVSWPDFNVYQVLLSDTTTTIDGTVYTYAAEGSYGTGGTLPYNAYVWGDTAPTPANVLKVTTATDRQGNVTTYTYSGAAQTFGKVDGTTTETPLTSVTMPNGHVITFTWGNGTTTGPTNRVYTVSDNGSARTVTYGYDESGDLTSVQTPGGKVTTYTYAAPSAPANWNSEYGLRTPTAVLYTIADPRGLVTTIHSQMAFINFQPYNVLLPGVTTYRVDDPNGLRTYISTKNNDFPDADAPGGSWGAFSEDLGDPGSAFLQIAGWGSHSWLGASGTGTLINSADIFCTTGGGGSSTTLTVNAIDGTDRHSLVGGATAIRWTKTYNVPNETLTIDDETTYPEAFDWPNDWGEGVNNLHGLPTPGWSQQDVITTKGYNFMGNPLSVVTAETVNGSSAPYRTAETDYAYWPPSFNKYYQQKATKDQAGRYTFTDYYPSTAGAGSRGQTYEVFSGAYATLDGTTGSGWRTSIAVDSGSTGKYSAQFFYDSVGRATDVYKLQNSSAWTYVQTHTAYAADSSPAWGEASSVVEDYGGIGRTTTTNGYTPWGAADDVTDAAGHRFVTTYDSDGVVQSVSQAGVSTPIVSYVYWTSGVSNGMPWTITDGLSGVVQTLTYDSTSGDGGIGQVATVQETNGSDVYTSSYTYDSAGNRATVKYQTPSSTNYWRYDDYDRMGTPDNPKYAFQTLTKSDSTGEYTSESMHYLYDSQGRLECSAFAQTPTTSSALSGGVWYNSANPAATRALAYYTYDPAGRVTELDHYWQIYNTFYGTYTSDYLVGDACAYEVSSSGTAPNRGLKTGDTFLTQNTSAPTTSTTAWAQSYGYDANFDYLTSASYGDGQPHASQSWTYDAAGNRASDYTGSGWSYDNLNRMTASPGSTYTNDILGNRTGTTTGYYMTGAMTWDCLNRMTFVNMPAAIAHTDFEYRADGMRVQKSYHSGMVHSISLPPPGSGPTSEPAAPTSPSGDVVAWYRYDGQMPMQTSVLRDDGSSTLTNNGLGARGIDYVLVLSTPVSGSPTTTIAFPIYDAHGNEVATLSRSGSSYALANQRSYGAWGEVRQGASTGGPRGRYCGNLGHVQDDESGLVYMRARYYEVGSGRFISEDPSMNGVNWFIYASDNPIRSKDSSGRDPIYDDGSGIWQWFNTVGQDIGFGRQLQGIVNAFQSGEIDVKDAAEKMGEIWHNLPANFYPGVVAGVNGAWQMCVKIPQLMCEILGGDFDFGSGISGDIEEIIEQACEITFEFTISGAE